MVVGCAEDRSPYFWIDWRLTIDWILDLGRVKASREGSDKGLSVRLQTETGNEAWLRRG